MDYGNLRKKLHAHFGHRHFRPGQARAVWAALEGRDTLILMPTGSGKSLCFQLPALELEGLTVVVSPLIALMKDQVDQLNAKGIHAVEINSTLSTTARREAEENIAAGTVEFVYTTPEQIAVPEFRQLLKRQAIDLFVVDEAHRVSQWGHGFRPEFLALAEAIADLGRPPVLALTATASEDTIDDILLHLRIPDAEIIHTGFHRPNLKLQVSLTGAASDKNEVLLQSLRDRPGSAIIYTALVKSAEAVCELIQSERRAGLYHGKLAAKKRNEIQDRFMAAELDTVVATNAFGLGIDKPDIRQVIHFEIPGNIESYYQEFGRAGRDGEPATCTLLYHPDDLKQQRFLSAKRFPTEDELVNAYRAVERAARSRNQTTTVAQIEELSPVTRSRLRACLDVFSQRRILFSLPGRKVRLLQPDLSREQIERSAVSYQERQTQVAVRQQQMREYAEEFRCRWQRVLAYFQSDELAEPCGHCDVCIAAAS